MPDLTHVRVLLRDPASGSVLGACRYRTRHRPLQPHLLRLPDPAVAAAAPAAPHAGASGPPPAGPDAAGEPAAALEAGSSTAGRASEDSRLAQAGSAGRRSGASGAGLAAAAAEVQGEEQEAKEEELELEGWPRHEGRPLRFDAVLQQASHSMVPSIYEPMVRKTCPDTARR